MDVLFCRMSHSVRAKKFLQLSFAVTTYSKAQKEKTLEVNNFQAPILILHKEKIVTYYSLFVTQPGRSTFSSTIHKTCYTMEITKI